MSRTSAPQRPLTLTEELERLEQSITLTLQEIDHNFSRAHRIVTTSILPVVEQYAEHSQKVWEGSKFWKQFFESSANVSLSGYEEQPSMQAFDETVTEESHATTHTTLEQESYATPATERTSHESNPEDLDMSNLTLSPTQSTPRASVAPPELTATFAEYPSPYEALRREVTASDSTLPAAQNDPITPGKTTAFNDISMTPESSPFIPPNQASISRPSTTQKKTDPILHRVLDKNYRVAATPLTSQRTQYQSRQQSQKDEATTPATATRFTSAGDFSSSPVMPEAPQINSEIFSSPFKTYDQTPGTASRKQRTPGVSVMTPGKPSGTAAPTWDSDSDEDTSALDGVPAGMSPPKTFQFHVPQSRLLKTPAQEASKRIVHSLLQSAGAQLRTPVAGNPAPGDPNYLDPEFDFTDEIDYNVGGHDAGNPHAGAGYDDYDYDDFEAGHDGNDVADSPSVVKGRGGNLGDMTF